MWVILSHSPRVQRSAQCCDFLVLLLAATQGLCPVMYLLDGCMIDMYFGLGYRVIDN
jgi:hypothetical protein